MTRSACRLAAVAAALLLAPTSVARAAGDAASGRAPDAGGGGTAPPPAADAAAAGPGDARSPSAAGDETAGPETEELRVEVEARLRGPDGAGLGADDELPLGARATLEVEVRAPARAKTFVPTNPELDPFRALGALERVERRKTGEGRVVEVHRAEVMPLRFGASGLPAIEVVYRAPGADEGSVRTERLPVRVVRRFPERSSPSLADAPPPVSVRTTNWVLVWGLSIGGAAVGAALLTMLLLRLLRGRLEAARPPPPPRPADEVAREQLDALESVELDAAERYARAVDVLREYLGGRYGFDGLELTSRELMDRLADADLRGVAPTEIRGLLEEGDLVKFARFEPSGDEAHAAIPRVRRIVEATWVPPEPEEPELPRSEPRYAPATAVQRLGAGGVDVALALAAAGLAVGGLWAADRLAWSGLAVLVAGAVLLLRDVAGPGSPGKAMLGLRVARRRETAEGEGADEVRGDRRGGRSGPVTPPRRPARVLRNLLLAVPPVGLPVEALVLIYHPLRRRVGDLWARTEVVGVVEPADRGAPTARASARQGGRG